MSAILEGGSGQTGKVCNQAVNAEVGESAHQRRLVDGPHRHMQALTLRFLQAFRRTQRPVQRQNLAAVALRDLQRVEPGVLGDQTARHIRHQIQRRLQHFPRARGDGHLVEQAVALRHFPNRQHGGGSAGARCTFDFKLPVLEIALLEQLFQRRNRARLDPARAALTRIKCHQVGGRLLDDLAATVGGALERRVVDDHQLAVL